MVKNYYAETITSIYFKTKKVRLNLGLTKVFSTIRLLEMTMLAIYISKSIPN